MQNIVGWAWESCRSQCWLNLLPGYYSGRLDWRWGTALFHIALSPSAMHGLSAALLYVTELIPRHRGNCGARASPCDTHYSIRLNSFAGGQCTCQTTTVTIQLLRRGIAHTRPNNTKEQKHLMKSKSFSISFCFCKDSSCTIYIDSPIIKVVNVVSGWPMGTISDGYALHIWNWCGLQLVLMAS